MYPSNEPLMYQVDTISEQLELIQNMSDEDMFFGSISPEEGETIMEILSEVANGANHNCVHSIDITNHNDTNVTMQCVFCWKGIEYSVELDDGNWNGTVINDWVWEWGFLNHYELLPIQYNIMPLSFPDDPISVHLLLTKWERMIESRKLDYVIYNYAYDRFVESDPFIQSLHHYNEMAKSEGFKIVTQPVADQFREELMKVIK